MTLCPSIAAASFTMVNELMYMYMYGEHLGLSDCGSTKMLQFLDMGKSKGYPYINSYAVLNIVLKKYYGNGRNVDGLKKSIASGGSMRDQTLL